MEPEIDIHAPDKKACEVLLKRELLANLSKLNDDTKLMFKLTIPDVPDFYNEVIADKHVLRVVALSGGYTREEANAKLAENPGLIASFSRALTEGLNVRQSAEEFDAMLKNFIVSIYEASMK